MGKTENTSKDGHRGVFTRCTKQLLTHLVAQARNPATQGREGVKKLGRYLSKGPKCKGGWTIQQ